VASKAGEILVTFPSRFTQACRVHPSAKISPSFFRVILSAFAEDHGRKAVDECGGGPSEARRAKEGASADFAEEMKDTTGVSPWRLHS